jgi:membrane protein DedA with SNARE-associated domain
MIDSWWVWTRAEVLAGQAEPPDGGVVGLVTDLVERLGGPGAGLAVALENLFPPIPSEVILPLAGFAASQGKMNLFAAIGWTTLGSVVGAVLLYCVGVAFGRDRIRAVAVRLPLVKLDDVDRTEAWFARHGAKAVFFGRMIPIFRSLISIPAGVERMPVARFLLYTALGSLIWNTVFVMAGYLLGENWHSVESYVGTFQNLVIAGCALAVGYFVISRLVRARRKRSAAPGAFAPEGASEPGTRDAGFDGADRAGRGTVYGKPRRPSSGAS